MWGSLSVFAGNANRPLAQAICDHLRLPLGQAKPFQFSNENIFVKIDEPVREQDVFIVQPTCSPVNYSIMELLIMIDAVKRASAARITAVVPYFAYSRTDKKDQPRVPITARLVADLITVAGADRVLTMDLHAGQIQGFFHIPVDELTAFYILNDYFRQKGLTDVVVVAPDLGAAKKARNFAERLNAPLAVIEKRRVGTEGRAEVFGVLGEVKAKRAILFDDEVDTAGSVLEAMELLQARGVEEFYACCTHPVLSGCAIDRLRKSDIAELVTTDTIPIPPEKHKDLPLVKVCSLEDIHADWRRVRLDRPLPIIKVLSVARLLGEAIRRIHEGGSIGALFE